MRMLETEKTLERVVAQIGASRAKLLLQRLSFAEWSCFCDPPRRHDIGFTKRGGLYSACRVCQSRIFWSDLSVFLHNGGVCKHVPAPEPTKKPGRLTTWCPECGVRTFFPRWLNDVDQLAFATGEEESLS